jgi:hypothetical protein
LIWNEAVKRIVKLSQESGSIFTGVLKMKDKDLDLTFEKIQELGKQQKAIELDTVDFDGNISDDLLKYALQQAEKNFTAELRTDHRRLASSSDEQASEAVKSELSKLRVNGHAPVSTEEWRIVLYGLRVKKFQDELENLGFQTAHIFTKDGAIHEEFRVMLQTTKAIRELLDTLPQADQEKLRAITVSIGDNRAAQAQRRQLTKEIEALESDLVEAKVLLKLTQQISAEDLGQLSSLAQTVGRLKKNDSAKGTDRSCRHHEEYVKAFSASVGLMLFLVMTTKQVNELVSLCQVAGNWRR